MTINHTEASELNAENLHHVMGLGIAGNFAGHLEQAGETPDFVEVECESDIAPKGLFPYFIPEQPAQIGVYPFSASQIKYPENLQNDAHLQAEPEVCVLFDMKYEFGKVARMQPIAFAAFNDCSIRKPGAKKISEKKNWGPETKGVSNQFLPVSRLDEGGELDEYRIIAYFKRDEDWQLYGNDSPISSYSYFHQKLMDWMQDKLNHQADFGPLENLNQWIHQANFPKQLLISLGATTYTELGENTFLQSGDEIAIFVYHQSITKATIENGIDTPETLPAGKVSVLKQKIV